MCKNIYDAYIYILQKIDRVYRDDELFCWKKSFQYLVFSAGNSINFNPSGAFTVSSMILTNFYFVKTINAFY